MAEPAAIVCPRCLGIGKLFERGPRRAQLGRAFIGIELERRWFDMACRRIEQATRQGDMLRDVLPSQTQAPLPLGDAT